VATDLTPDPDTWHQAELDRLVTDLVEAGFRPVDGRRLWEGPIHPPLARLTDAPTMRIEIGDGWPYRHPRVYVEGLIGRKHVGPTGDACLWFDDDGGYWDWTRLEPILARIDGWVADQEAGVSEPAPDTHLYFRRRASGLLTVDVEGLIADGRVHPHADLSGPLSARRTDERYVIGVPGNLSATWFWRREPMDPPSELDDLRASLASAQQRDLDGLLGKIRRNRPGIGLVLWEDARVIHALGLLIERQSTGPKRVVALEVARTDASVLRLRSGPDAPRLAEASVVVFGIGAIGSEISMHLARSGVRRLTLVDHERLRPGNLTRHAASGRYVGRSKPEAMAATINDAFPDVTVTPVSEVVWSPRDLLALTKQSSIVVDATANEAYTSQLSRIAESVRVPLVSAALHRRGRIARVRIQAGATWPIWNRSPEGGSLDIPIDPAEPSAPVWETGCGAPVMDVPPVSVVSAGTRAARSILDVMTGRDRCDRDIVEVYEPIEAEPFQVVGTYTFEGVTR